MARNKGRRPADSKPAPDSRPTSSGTTDSGARGTSGGPPANGTAGAAGTAGADATASAAPRPVDPEARAGTSPSAAPVVASPAVASPGGAAQPGVTTTAASAAGAPSGKPGTSSSSSSSGAAGASGRPPSGGSPVSGSPTQSRPQGASAPPPRNGSRHSFRNGLIGGLIGGIVAALALTYMLRPNDGAELATLRGQVDQLDATVEKLQGGTANLDQLTSRIEALEQAAPPGIDEELQARLDALQQASPSALNEDLQARLAALEQTAPSAADLADRVAALEQSLASGAPPAAADERVQSLQEELAKLSATVAAQAIGKGDTTTSDLALLETLQSRLAAIESNLPDSKVAADVALRLDALAQRVDVLEPLGQQSAGNQSRLEGLASQIDGLEAQIDGVGKQVEALHGDVEGLSSRVADTENRITSAGDRREQAAALALLTNQIETAIAQSRGYDAPLRSLTGLGQDDEVVRAAADQLAPSAAAGVPSLAQLRRSFESVAPEIVRSARAPEGDSLMDRAAGNLMRLVSVRPVGADVEGDGAAARVARAEAHLAAGDLAPAVAEVEALKGPAAEAAAGWLADAKSRLAVTAALDRLQTRTGELLTPGN